MSAYLLICWRIFYDFQSSAGRFFLTWLAIVGIIATVSVGFSPRVGMIVTLVLCLVPLLLVFLVSLFSTFVYWRNEEPVLLSDVTRRQFYENGKVHEIWTREFLNVSSKTMNEGIDFYMFWEKPLAESHPVTIHTSKRFKSGRQEDSTEVHEISQEHPDYTERPFGDRKFYGCIVTLPLVLEP